MANLPRLASALAAGDRVKLARAGREVQVDPAVLSASAVDALAFDPSTAPVLTPTGATRLVALDADGLAGTVTPEALNVALTNTIAIDPVTAPLLASTDLSDVSRIVAFSAAGGGAVTTLGALRTYFNIGATAPAAPATPTLPALSGLLAYYDLDKARSVFADTAGTVAQAADGGTVKLLTDYGGDSRRVGRTSDTNLPTLAPGAFGSGKPGLRFTASSMQRLGTFAGDPAWMAPAQTQGLTWMAVVKAGFTALDNGVIASMFRNGDNSSDNMGALVLTNALGGRKRIAFQREGTNFTGSNFAIANDDTVAGAVYVIVARFDLATLTTRLKINGADLPPVVGQGITQGAPWDNFQLGGLRFGNFNGDFVLRKAAFWLGSKADADAQKIHDFGAAA